MPEDSERSFVAILIEDVVASIKRNDQNTTQLQKRDLVRSLFAACEGLVWVLREHVTQAAEKTGGIEEGELRALSEKAYIVSKDGVVSSQQRFVPLPNALRLCARIAKRLDSTLEFDFSGTEWRTFLEAIRIRNRLTHPKNLDDVVISNSEALQCVEAFFWLLELVTDSMESANRALKMFNAEFRKIFDDLEANDASVWREYRDALIARD